MKFLDNIYDPRRPDAKMLVPRQEDETQEEAWQHRQKWLADKVLGEPQATENRTVEQLKGFYIVGVYDPNG